MTCQWDLGGPSGEVCLHSEGCTEFTPDPPSLSFAGLVTSAATGEPLAGVAVRIEAPARASSASTVTDSAGRYWSYGLPDPKAGNCAGLSVSFSKAGYEPLRVTDFPQLTCGPVVSQLNASLTPTS